MMVGKSKAGRALKAAKKPTQTKITKKVAPKKEKPQKKPEKPAPTTHSVLERVDEEPAEKPMLSLAERLGMKRTESTSSSSSVTSEVSVPSKKQTTLAG